MNRIEPHSSSAEFAVCGGDPDDVVIYHIDHQTSRGFTDIGFCFTNIGFGGHTWTSRVQELTPLAG